MGKTYVYIGSWHFQKNSSDFGVAGYAFDPQSGGMQFLQALDEDTMISGFCFDPGRGMLYALADVDTLPGLRGGGGGMIFAYRIDPETGLLEKIGTAETFCPSPCYITLDESGRFLVVAHHTSHSCVTKIGQDAFGNYFPIVERDDAAVELFSVEEDGRIGKLLDVKKHTGSGPAHRQTHPHPHSAVRSPSGALYAVCDKGNDTVRMYKLDQERGKLVEPCFVWQHEGGREPRHCVFHPTKPWFYHNNEITEDLDAFTYTEDGVLRDLRTYRVVPDKYESREPLFSQQGLAMHPSGRYLYDVVCGPDLVTAFQVDQQDGSLQVIQHKLVEGKWPRGCAISPDGKFLLVCCVNSGEVMAYAIGSDGCLQETGTVLTKPFAADAVFCRL